jgi:hypothetical protein
MTLSASGKASVSAIAAQFVAALEIHWSCSCGKPASKEDWNAPAFACRCVRGCLLVDAEPPASGSAQSSSP